MEVNNNISDVLIPQAYDAQLKDGRIALGTSLADFDRTLRENYPTANNADTYMVDPVIVPDMCEPEFYIQQSNTMSANEMVNMALGLQQWIRDTQL